MDKQKRINAQQDKHDETRVKGEFGEVAVREGVTFNSRPEKAAEIPAYTADQIRHGVTVR
ncbi:hypothetical protein C9426_24060 [Serratia sp. S1B]|nr:hypothetical protein C9426_24060 [Serratia sp. S1B]